MFNGYKVLVITCSLLIFMISAPVQAKDFGVDHDLIKALKQGEVGANFRLSYEHSDLENNSLESADALTLRSRLEYRSQDYRNFQLFLQAQDVTAFVDDYSPEDTNHDVIADPDKSSMHQLYLDYKGFNNSLLRLGRQEIILQNARLVGNVGWRQNAQSFNAGLLRHEYADDITLRAAYIDEVKTILDQRAEPDHLVLLEGEYNGFNNHVFNLYSYFLDMPGGTVNDRDKASYGARLTGRVAGFDYALDYTIQRDYQDSDTDAGAMFNGFLSRTVGDLKLGAGYSQIDGADGDDRAFDTLFSTAHKFNGWSDQFLGTNGGLATGLEDLYVQISTTWSDVFLLARYHDFEQETSGEDYGSEFNLLAKKQLYDDLSGLIKYATYDADSENTSGTGQNDEDVVWVRLTYEL